MSTASSATSSHNGVAQERTAVQILESIEQRIAPQSATPKKRESDELKDLYKALHAAQVKFKSIEKTGIINAHGTSRRYAKIDDLVDATRKALHENNLVVSTYNYTYADGFTTLVTRLMHFPSGQWTESELPLLNSQDEQKRGSSITYAWRYTYAPLLGLVDSSYDDDGETTAPQQWKK